MEYATTYKRKGTITLFFRAHCACGIWKDVQSAAIGEAFDHNEARATFDDAGWTSLHDDPTCAKCSETAALNATLDALGRAP